MEIKEGDINRIRNNSFALCGMARTLDLYNAYSHSNKEMEMPEGRLLDLFYSMELQLDKLSDWLLELADMLESDLEEQNKKNRF